MNSLEMEIALARYFGTRRNTIVPNVYWGMGLNHECDLFVVSAAGYVTEVEIKVSAADIKKDLEKRKWLPGLYDPRNVIKRFFYAVPDKLKDCEHLPKDKGLIVVTQEPRPEQGWLSGFDVNGDYYRCDVARQSQINKQAKPLSDSDLYNVTRLGCMRIFDLKEKILHWKNKVMER